MSQASPPPDYDADVEIHPLANLAEFHACVALQEETWGSGFSERVPTAILKVAQMLGGVASGAWSPDGVLLGFVFGMTGLRDGEVVHWSDMLAVRPSARGRGIGRALKLHQRELLLERGVRVMLWTFDPLRAENAYFNFARLGVVARDYRRDMYGETDSPLHAGIGTDRLIAHWALDSARVEERLTGCGWPLAFDPADPSALGVAPEGRDDEAAIARPGEPRLGLDASRVRVSVPRDLGTLLGQAPEVARAWRARTRIVLEHYLGRGWSVGEFIRDSRSPGYLLVRTPDDDPSTATTRTLT